MKHTLPACVSESGDDAKHLKPCSTTLDCRIGIGIYGSNGSKPVNADCWVDEASVLEHFHLQDCIDMSVWPAGLCGPYDLAVTGVALWEEAQGACKPSIARSLRSIACCSRADTSFLLPFLAV